jgi:hypothetical protein
MSGQTWDSTQKRSLELMEKVRQLREHEGAFEGFSYQGQLWNVFKARLLVADRKPEALVIDEAPRPAADMPSAVEWWTTDLPRTMSDPVIIIPLPAEVFGPAPGDLDIDGFYRAWLALSGGIGELPAHFLTPTEEREIRESDPWDGFELNAPWHAQRREE